MISSTRTSGAEAPAVMPSAADSAEQAQSMSSARRTRRDERAARPFGDFPQPLRIGRIGRADDDHGIDARRHALHRLLAVGGGVADVFLVRADDIGKARLQRRDHLARVVDRERRLGDIGQVVGRPAEGSRLRPRSRPA